MNYGALAWCYKEEEYFGLCLKCYTEDLEEMLPDKDKFLEDKYKGKVAELKELDS